MQRISWSVVSRHHALVLMLMVAAPGCEPTNQGYAPTQPIAYSHAMHAGMLDIDCQYCHFGAQRGRYAGIPPAQVCMNCHKQVKTDHPEVQKVAQSIEQGTPIEWVRVHNLPDHVYFNHQPHVRAGLACQECHGQVESMGRVEQVAPLTMGWCLNCHRTGGEPTPPGGPTPPPVVTHLTDCTTCHH